MKRIRQLLVFILVVLLAVSCFTFVGCKGGKGNKTQEFYDKIVESQTCLDNFADDIYDCWYDAIYNDEYLGNINYAIAYAISNNEENKLKIEENDIIIKSLYKDIKDSELSDEIKAVMLAYSDYYEFVMNVSGSFSTFKENKENYKKAFASAIKTLAFEM